MVYVLNCAYVGFKILIAVFNSLPIHIKASSRKMGKLDVLNCCFCLHLDLFLCVCRDQDPSTWLLAIAKAAAVKVPDLLCRVGPNKQAYSITPPPLEQQLIRLGCHTMKSG